MGVLTEIKEILKLVAFNQKVAKWFVFILVIVAGGAFLYFKYRPTKEDDCDFIKQQNRELIAFILEAKKEVEKLQVQPTSYIQGEWEFIFASDTTIPIQTQKQKKVMLLNRFDSVLNKVKADSVRRTKKG